MLGSLLVSAFVGTLAGCGGIAESTEAEASVTGQVAMRIDIRATDGSALPWNSSVNYAIVGARFQRMGSLSAGNQPTFFVSMESIPVGERYAITLQSSASGRSCSGSAAFSVAAMQTTSVGIVLECKQ